MADTRFRDEKLDILTILACFLVVLYHECGNYTDGTSITGEFFRKVLCILAEVAVPLFVMKSGAVFLNPQRQVTLAQMAKKCLKILGVIALWGMLYNLISNVLIDGFSWKMIFTSARSVITADTSFNYQFWYLYMLLGLYTATPIIKRFTDTAEKKELLWCIALLLAEGCIVPFACEIVGVDTAMFWGTKFLGIYGDYFLYFLLGTYLRRYPLTKNSRIVLAAMLITAAAFCVDEVLNRGGEQIWMAYLSPFTVLYATMAYDSLMRICVSEKVVKRRTLAQMADTCFGIYILHVMVIVGIRKIVGIDCSWANAVISVPIMTVMTWCLCYVIVRCVNRVPVLRKIALW